MSNRNWLSRGQQDFINDHVQQFRDAKASGTLAVFYEEFYGNWFTRFPELSIIFPDANTMNDLSKEDKEELEWHVNNKKAVCFQILSRDPRAHASSRNFDGCWHGQRGLLFEGGRMQYILIQVSQKEFVYINSEPKNHVHNSATVTTHCTMTRDIYNSNVANPFSLDHHRPALPNGLVQDLASMGNMVNFAVNSAADPYDERGDFVPGIQKRNN
jgi:hypothetical protein